MAEVNYSLTETYHLLEIRLKQEGNAVFSDILCPWTFQKVSSRAVNVLLLRKMQNEMLQARFLEIKAHIISMGLRYTEICDPTLEALEKLFDENGFHVYTYIANMMIVLLRRSVFGLENVGVVNARKVLDLYAEVSKSYYDKEFSIFKPIFKELLLPGSELCDYIYVKMHQYIAFHYRFHGTKGYGVLMMAKYFKLRLQYLMYTKLENLLAEILLLAIQALESPVYLFKQARHLITVVYEHTKRIQEIIELTHIDPKKMIILKEFAILAESLYITMILKVSKDRWDMILTDGERDPNFVFCKDYEKFKEDIEDLDLPITTLEDIELVQVLYDRLCSLGCHIEYLKDVFIALKGCAKQLYPLIIKDKRY